MKQFDSGSLRKEIQKKVSDYLAELASHEFYTMKPEAFTVNLEPNEPCVMQLDVSERFEKKIPEWSGEVYDKCVVRFAKKLNGAYGTTRLTSDEEGESRDTDYMEVNAQNWIDLVKALNNVLPPKYQVDEGLLGRGKG